MHLTSAQRKRPNGVKIRLGTRVFVFSTRPVLNGCSLSRVRDVIAMKIGQGSSKRLNFCQHELTAHKFLPETINELSTHVSQRPVNIPFQKSQDLPYEGIVQALE